MHISNWKKKFKYFFSLGKYPLNIIQEMALKLDIFKFLHILYQGISDTRGDSLPMTLFLIPVFLPTQTVSRMIQGTIYIPLCTLAKTYNPTPCSHGNKWYPHLGFESYSSRKDSMWRVVMEERATSLGMLKN